MVHRGAARLAPRRGAGALRRWRLESMLLQEGEGNRWKEGGRGAMRWQMGMGDEDAGMWRKQALVSVT
jgi:hypothetical protein